MNKILCGVVALILVGYAIAETLECKGAGRGGSRLGAGITWCPSGDNCTSASECSGSCTRIITGTYWICYTGFCVCTDYYGKTTLAPISPRQRHDPDNASAVPCISFWNIAIGLCIVTLIGGGNLGL